MPIVTPDFSEVQDEVTPGTYSVVVRKGTLMESQSGFKYINWEMETYGESDTKNNGRRIFLKTPIAGGAAFKLQRFYKAATGEALTGSLNTEQLHGKKVTVEVVEGVDKNGAKTGYTDIKNVRAATV